MNKKIIVEGLYEDANKRCKSWDRRSEPFNYEIDGESIFAILAQFEDKNIRISIETVEDKILDDNN